MMIMMMYHGLNGEFASTAITVATAIAVAATASRYRFEYIQIGHVCV